MQLRRPGTPRRLISLVSMIDVLLIMLVFFMVTSTYLNLDMIPVAQAAQDTPTPAVAGGAAATPLIIRLGPDGAAYLRGQITPPEALTGRVQVHLAENPSSAVLILPSPRADTQSLVSMMDLLTRAGVRNLRILQLAARP
jgi:biopolymer transport protein ExbD